MLQVGAAAVDITPPLGSGVAGQFRDRRAKVIHDPLLARALVMDDGRAPWHIVACDLLSLKRRTVVEARRRAAALTGIAPERILLTASHTHTGPRTADLFPVPADANYLARLPRQLASVLELAQQVRQPAQIGAGAGREASAAHNRRFLRADSSARMHPPKGDPAFVGPEGPDDPQLGVIAARNADGALLGAVVNYSSHPIVVGAEEAASADYPGYLVRALDAVYGCTGRTLFINGAYGNVCPIDVYDLQHRDYGYAWAERVGHSLAGEALRVLAQIDPLPNPSLAAVSVTVELTLREVGDDQIEQARALLAAGEDGPWVERVYAQETLLLAEERRGSPTVAAEVQVLRLGEAALVGIPGELFVEFGLEIKRRSPLAHTFIAGMANGCVGYLPTREAFVAGGYETRLARSSKLTPDAGERLVAAALDLLQSVAPR